MDTRIESIDRAYVEQLVSNKVPEGRTLEYKEALPRVSDSEKKEFLADVASFANSTGGDIFYGIEEDRDPNGRATGTPKRVAPIPGINVDQTILALESSIRDGIAPRLHGVRMKSIPGFSSGCVLMIRVPQSWSAPHMVTYKSNSRFFSRGSAGKYPLDISEIRSAFALTGSRQDHIQSFRSERLGRIVANETPVMLRQDSAKSALHIVPFSTLDPLSILDLDAIATQLQRLTPMYDRGYNQRFNFDGILHFSPSGESGSTGYVQLFRNGSIEAVDAAMLASNRGGRKVAPGSLMESVLVRASTTYLGLLKQLNIDPPFIVMLSLLGVKDYILAAPQAGFDEAYPIDRETLLLPDVLIEEQSVDIGSSLRPIFDAFWQAGGYSGSPHYDSSGTWVAPT
jgi:hypothetical protein